MNASNFQTESERPDDVDPVIDTLLAEFVPSDPSRRKRPPDLSARILAQLASPPSTGGPRSQSLPSVQTAGSGSTSGEYPKAVGGGTMEDPVVASRFSASRVLSLMAAIAACVAGVIYLGPTQSSNDGDVVSGESNRVAQLDGQRNGPASVDAATGVSSSAVADLMVEKDDTDNEIDQLIRPVPESDPLVAADSTGRVTIPMAEDDPSRSIPDATVRPSLPIDQVATRVNQSAQDYWKALGIEPTKAVAESELSQRLKQTLGVDLFPSELSGPETIRDALARDSSAQEIARRWLALTSGTSVNAIRQDENAELVREIGRGFSGQSAFDTTLVSLIDGTSEQSPVWYETIGRGGHEGIARRLATVSMNADLRCVKCHDSMVGRFGTQEDYWSFVALVRSTFGRDDDRWVIETSKKTKPTFFELPDGRQRLAVPNVSEHFLPEGELRPGQRLSKFDQWTRTLAGSETLAGSMVDTLWQMVHGRKLKPSPIDALAAPADPNLERLHRELTLDLLSSGFDLSRTLALVIQSPMANRSLPDALQGDALLTATERERRDALDLVGAFAASLHTPRSSVQDRIGLAMRRTGGQLTDTETPAVLAQPDYGDAKERMRRSASRDLASKIKAVDSFGIDFPAAQAGLPVAWLRSIDRYEDQVRHLVYLSGRSTVSKEIKEVAEQLNRSGSREAALSRLWWILK